MIMWEFNKEVADRFEDEAKNNIPDYDRVINLCLDIAKIKLPQYPSLIDIGSATGITVEKFIDNGFLHTYGVESSEAMIEKCRYKQMIVHSDKFPVGIRVNMAMANWTLHFIKERKQYIQDVYKGLYDDGIFILSDKTTQTKEIKDLYYQFKIANGVSEEYIVEKEQQLKGYMDLYPVEWYIDTLKEVGFKNIQIINARLGFVTFYCEK